MGKIRLLLADDHAVLRGGLRALLNSQSDMEVIAEAADGEEAIRKSVELTPDIVIMDISMPILTGLEATKEIKKRNPAVKVLVLTVHEDESYLHRMLRAGANGYVPKKAADTELLAAIRATYQEEHFIHSSMTAGLITVMRLKEMAGGDEQNPDGLSNKRLPSEIEVAVYRIVQEALTNTAKYSKTKKASVILRYKEGTLMAIIEDNGSGFDVSQIVASASEKKLGLFGMYERASLIGGKLTIESRPGAGTTVFLEVQIKLPSEVLDEQDKITSSR